MRTRFPGELTLTHTTSYMSTSDGLLLLVVVVVVVPVLVLVLVVLPGRGGGGGQCGRMWFL